MMEIGRGNSRFKILINNADFEPSIIAMTGDTFSILIVTFNNQTCILDLLDDIYSVDSEYLKRTTIIDNNSSDATAAVIQQQYPQVNLIQNPKNIGYGSAVNQGSRLLDTPFFFLLNPDLRVPKVFFEDMLALTNLERLAAAGPIQYKIRRKKLFLNFTWSFLKPESFLLFLKKKVQPEKRFSKPIRVSFLNAGCLLLNKTAFEEVGGFDEKYFLYGEEPDLFLKYKAYKYHCYLHPGVEVNHLRDQSMHSLPFLTYLKYRLLAVRNILDALIRGYFRVLQMHSSVED